MRILPTALGEAADVSRVHGIYRRISVFRLVAKPRTVSLRRGIMRGLAHYPESGTIMAVPGNESRYQRKLLSRLSRHSLTRISHRFVLPEVGVNSGSFSVSVTPPLSSPQPPSVPFPPSCVPDIARKFVGNGVCWTQVDTVSAPAADGSRTVSTEVKVNGMPVSAQATQKLTPRVSRPAWTSTVKSPAPSRWWAEDCGRC